MSASASRNMSPVSAGFKYHLQDASKQNGQLSLATIVRVFPPSGSSAFRTHHVTGDVRLAADWTPSSQWSFNPNIGVAIAEDSSGQAFPTGLAALTVTYGPNNRFQPYLDAGLQSPETRAGRVALLFDGGVTYLIDRNTQVDFGIGTGVKPQNARDHSVTSEFGVPACPGRVLIVKRFRLSPTFLQMAQHRIAIEAALRRFALKNFNSRFAIRQCFKLCLTSPERLADRCPHRIPARFLLRFGIEAERQCHTRTTGDDCR